MVCQSAKFAAEVPQENTSPLIWSMVKVSPICDPYVGEVPVREDTCSGSWTLLGRAASSFPCRFYLPSVPPGPHSLLGEQ